MQSKEEKRIEILQAAVKVFSEAGFEGAKIEDIAKEAGIGKGTVYEYFDSKTTLFQEMFRYTVEKYREGQMQALAQGDDFREKLINFSKYHADYLREHLDVVNTSALSLSLSEELRSQLMREWTLITRTLEDMVQEAIQNGELRANVDKEMAAACIMGSIKHYIAKKVFMDKVPPQDIDHAGMVKLILTGLVW